MWDQWSKATPVIFFIMGLGGSLHCLGMCGPLVMSLTKNKSENAFYQIGRLFGYISLGIVIKMIGFGLINQKENFLIITAGVLLGLFYILQGLSLLRLIKEIKFPFFNFLTKFAHNKMKLKPSPLMAGFLSAFLPCGLLYTTIFSLLILQNTQIAFLSLLSFWLGTLPMLMFSTTMMTNFFRPIMLKIPKLAGGFLLVIGLATLILRLSPLIHQSNGHCMHCHDEKITSKD